MKSMRFRLFALVAALTVVCAPAFSGTITFDEVGLVPGYGPFGSPTGTYLTNELASLGVLFSDDGNGKAYVSSTAYIPSVPTQPGTPSSPFNLQFLAVNTTPPNTGTPMTLTLTFVSPFDINQPGWVLGSTINVWAQDSELSYTARAKDINGATLETITVSSGTAFQQVQFTTSGYVHTVEFYDTGADGINLDNYTYGPILTPEPGTFLLMGAGLLAVGVALRRKRS